VIPDHDTLPLHRLPRTITTTSSCLGRRGPGRARPAPPVAVGTPRRARGGRPRDGLDPDLRAVGAGLDPPGPGVAPAPAGAAAAL